MLQNQKAGCYLRDISEPKSLNRFFNYQAYRSGKINEKFIPTRFVPYFTKKVKICKTGTSYYAEILLVKTGKPKDIFRDLIDNKEKYIKQYKFENYHKWLTSVEKDQENKEEFTYLFLDFIEDTDVNLLKNKTPGLPISFSKYNGIFDENSEIFQKFN